ncbi:hypothetical protein GYB22_05910 [bacterium]|nr:hypothetical protein [bacterium]
MHEELVLHSDVKTQHLAGDLLHYSYYRVEEHIQREKKYAKLAAEKDKAMRKSPSAVLSYLKAAFRFLKMYILKLGFLHGKNGYQLCLISAKGKIWRHQFLVDSIGS